MTRRLAGIGFALLACVLALAAWTSGPAAGGLDSLRYKLGLTNGGTEQSSYPVRVQLPQATAPAAATGPGFASLAEAELVETDGGPAAVPAPDKGLGITTQPPATRAILVDADFDITTFGRVAPPANAGLRDSKPLIVGGTRIGMVDLILGPGSVVSVGRLDLAALVDGRAPRLSEALARMEGDRVTLDALRTRDVRVHYDPLSDALVIESAP